MESAKFKSFVFFFLMFTSINSVESDNNNLCSTVTSGNIHFAKKLFQEILNESEQDNIFFSPISVHAIFSLMYQGSKGETQKALANVLNVSEPTKTAENYKNILNELHNVKNVTLNIANKVWIKQCLELKASFKSLATDQFFVDIESISFSNSTNAAKLINNWVEQKTNNKIMNLIDSKTIDEISTVMVLVNVIHFKGDWKFKFDKENNIKRPFYISPNETVDVEMMVMEMQKFLYLQDKDLDSKVLVIPYANEDFKMIIVLPNESGGIKKLEEKIISKDWTTIFQNLKEHKLNILLPKFKIEKQINLKTILTKMGLDIIFSEKADFSDLFKESSDVKISNAIQKSCLEVNEEGSEAASASGILLANRFGSNDPFFVADHPFLLSILYKNEIIFVGKVVNPTVL